MRGASAIQSVLEQHASAPLSVFVVWEPVLPTDWITPTSGVLARIRDPRAVQFWDPDRRLSAKIIETRADPPPGGVVWDVVAVFPKGTRWENAFPSPVFQGYPVINAAEDLRKSLPAVLAP